MHHLIYTRVLQTFENKAETPVELRLASLKDIAVLKSKEWISFNDQADKYLHVGTRLVFTLDTCRRYKNEKVFHVSCRFLAFAYLAMHVLNLQAMLHDVR
jgi:hypothetical protein